MIYKSGVKPIEEPIEPAYWFLFYRDELLISADEKQGNHIPYFESVETIRSGLSDIQYLGTIDGKESYMACLTERAVPEGQGHVLMPLRKAYGAIDDEWYWLANRAYHLINWKQRNLFCGCCGAAMNSSADEVALVCGGCKNIVYPRISPAVIVAVTKGDEILLAHSARFIGPMYSIIAGFVEAGETLEECVRREIMEEVGLKVRNVKYVSSQPWPYPDSFMIAFTAEYEAGEIKIDQKEITDAGWYTRHNLPELPSRVSVARRLIDAWLSEKGSG
jgi:NAD+ diphosphatase